MRDAGGTQELALQHAIAFQCVEPCGFEVLLYAGQHLRANGLAADVFERVVNLAGTQPSGAIARMQGRLVVRIAQSQPVRMAAQLLPFRLI